MAKTSAEDTKTPAGKVGKRAAKLEKLKQAETINFSIDPDVRNFLVNTAKAQGLDLSHLMQKITESYVVEHAPSDTAFAQRLAGKRQVIDIAQKTAEEMDKEGAFDDHFILNVIKKSAADKAFVSAYDAATRAAGEGPRDLAKATRAKTALNQQLGRVIKRTVGAKSLRKPEGGIARASASDALITTYTLLTKQA
ncbi:MAG: hypothetical protein AAFQ19_06015 [Pseudomonadota bacterium]